MKPFGTLFKSPLRLILLFFLFCYPGLSGAQNISNLHNELDSIRQVHCPDASFSFWAESVSDTLVNSVNADSLWPTASAIKLFILPAFYQEFKADWDTVPDVLDSILNYEPGFQDPLHMFSASQRSVIDSVLSGFTYKQLAAGMMGIGSLGNASYNACANIAIFLLGGPAMTTSRIHSMHPDLSDVRIGRYMLEARTDSTDNINRMTDFATLVRMIHYQTIPSLQPSDYPKLEACIWSGTYDGRTYYQKSGGLTSAPSLRSRVGYIIDDNNTLIYALNLVAFSGTSDNYVTARNDMTLLMRDRLLEAKPVSSKGYVDNRETKIYPNPASHILSIETTQNISLITVYSRQGSKVLETYDQPVYIQSLAPGMYFLTLHTNDGKVIPLRFIKE